MSLGKNASPTLCFPGDTKGCVAAMEFSVFRRVALLHAFLFAGGSSVMNDQISLYGALSCAYDVAREISAQLEREYLQNSLDTHKQDVLSGFYSVIDFFSNLIAKLGLEEEDEDYDDPILGPDEYADAAKLMKSYVQILEQDLACDDMPSCVDYRKVHALVGLRAVHQFIEAET